MASSAAVQTLKRTLADVMKTSEFGKVVSKLTVVGGDKGKCVCEMKVEPMHGNLVGSLHGGCAATLIDIVSTIALATVGTGNLGVSTDMNITYLRPAKVGDIIVVEANALKVGRTLAFLTVDIRGKDSGALVAQGRHTKFIASQ